MLENTVSQHSSCRSDAEWDPGYFTYVLDTDVLSLLVLVD